MKFFPLFAGMNAWLAVTNPASTRITIQVNESDLGSQVIIFNALGQEVFSERIAVVNQLLNIEKLTEGFYFLKMEGRVIRLHVVR
jgi:hypothetical protein